MLIQIARSVKGCPSKRFIHVCSVLAETHIWNNETKDNTRPKPSISEYPVDKIRNFSIIAHVDHGKSTLADRLLEYTGTIQKDSKNQQVLDKLQVERERGITVKAQTSSMFWNYEGQKYLLNLIDTPGHVDFSYEVSRSLAACQGALLVVDAAQGIQAQTVANFYSALEAGLHVIPTINKIDLLVADPDKVSRQLESLFGFTDSEIVKVSAKEGVGITNILDEICRTMPSPQARRENKLSLFLFDSWYDKYRGVICLMAVMDGTVRKGDKLCSAHTSEEYEALDVGIMFPEEVSVTELYAGQVGYVVMGIRDVKQALVGDTFYHTNQPVVPMKGFSQPTSMVFAGIYPSDQSNYVNLRKAIDKLTLNDSSLTVHPDNSIALGQGWRVGFLGLLHMDVFKQRLAQEYNLDVIVTTPNVPYKAVLKGNDNQEIEIRSPTDFPEKPKTDFFMEPMVIGTLIFPEEYLGKIMTLCENCRGEQELVSFIDDSRVLLKYKLPLNEIVVDFFDQLKSISSGYASFDYESDGFQITEIEKLDVLLNGKTVDALSTIVHRTKARDLGKSYCFKLKNVIPRQLFEIVIQASVRGKVIARESIKPLRKDVTAKCYGGDITRKRKLLEKQKEGKRRMKKFGNIDVPHEAFLSLLKR